MLRTELYADPKGRFLHDVVLDSCRRNSNKTALVDASNTRRLSYAEYGETVEAIARGLTAAGVKPGDVVAIFLANSWEFCTSFHGVELAGAIPTLLMPPCSESSPPPRLPPAATRRAAASRKPAASRCTLTTRQYGNRPANG